MPGAHMLPVEGETVDSSSLATHLAELSEKKAAAIVADDLEAALHFKHTMVALSGRARL